MTELILLKDFLITGQLSCSSQWHELAACGEHEVKYLSLTCFNQDLAQDVFIFWVLQSVCAGWPWEGCAEQGEPQRVWWLVAEPGWPQGQVSAVQLYAEPCVDMPRLWHMLIVPWSYLHRVSWVSRASPLLRFCFSCFCEESPWPCWVYQGSAMRPGLRLLPSCIQSAQTWVWASEGSGEDWGACIRL